MNRIKRVLSIFLVALAMSGVATAGEGDPASDLVQQVSLMVDGAGLCC